ncbi:MAG: aminopeptidase P family protein [Nitrospirae bacterium]|nr:MAG: aminopeptidase P family protein [Nitrospirota bacterium]
MSHRVAALRALLQEWGLTGFLVPHADEYQNEYLPACAERLAWLTGFTGSAGMAVVLGNQAAIFVDGRYLLQVKTQVDPAVFMVYHLTDCPVHQWLAHTLSPNDRLGYDPWLHTASEVEQVRMVCEQVGATLVACETNPIDVIWSDRPPPPLAPVVPHEVIYAGKPSEEKRAEVAQSLRAQRVDAAIIAAPDSIAWLLNIRGGDVAYTPLPFSRLLLRSDGTALLFLDARKVGRDLQAHLGPEVTLCGPEAFGAALDALGKDRTRVLCDVKRTASWIVDRIRRAGAELVPGDDPCVLPKACKNAVELAGAREAHRRDGTAMCKFLAWLASASSSRQLTELEAQHYLDACRQEMANWKDQSFPTISAAGPHGAIVHYRATETTNRRLEPGTLYLVDSGGQYLDGTTDVTRTIAIGTPIGEHRDRYTRVLKGHIALATARFPIGTTGSQLDPLARRPLWDVGIDYDHGTGHGVGSYLGVHEGPHRVSKIPNSVALLPGMILSNEPGYYKPGEYGIRLENLLTVVRVEEKESKEWLAFETLTLVPFDVRLIELSLLTPAEIAWINGYHERVRQVITPLVDSSTAQWLEYATAALSGEIQGKEYL